MYQTTKRFWKCFENLLEPVKKVSKGKIHLTFLNSWLLIDDLLF